MGHFCSLFPIPSKVSPTPLSIFLFAPWKSQIISSRGETPKQRFDTILWTNSRRTLWKDSSLLPFLTPVELAEERGCNS